MDVPITKPSMVSYADELDFTQLLENLFKERHNGFLRITSGAEEGYILFKDGKQVAAEYDKLSKSEAIETIMSTVENRGTLIEVFDLRSSHIDYIIDVNKPFLMEPDYDISKIIDELKGTDRTETLIPENTSKSANTADSISKSEPVSESEAAISESETVSEVDVPQTEPVPDLEPELEADVIPESESDPESAVLESESDSEPVLEPVETSSETEDATSAQNGEEPTRNEVFPTPDTEDIPGVEETSVQPDSSKIEPDTEVNAEPLNRSKLLEKYGIRELNEDDVDDLLDTYKGGSLNEDDIEKIELTLMNKIKKSIFGIPKIKGTEVMVFMENAAELSGDINIIIEYERKGFLSKLMGESKYIDNLRRQVINIVQIEIKKSFRKYPEIVNNFNVNVEII